MDQANQLIDAAAKKNLFFAINFNHRYARPIVKAREAIQAGKLGHLVFSTIRFCVYGESAHPYANLIETQCHSFDQFEFLMGPIESVSAEMTDITKNGFSTMSIAMKFANGAVGNLLGSYDNSFDYTETHRLEVDGTEGRVIVRDTVAEYEYQKSGSESFERWQPGFLNEYDRVFHTTFDYHMEDMLRAFRTGNPPPVPAEAGRRALRLAMASIESFETGRRVVV
jgi:predicted dehydrogenase